VPRSVSLVAAVLSVALGCVSPGGDALHGRTLRVSGPYRHAATGAELPEQLGGLPRANVTSWDAADSNVGVTYDEPDRARVTVYLYPAGDALAGRLLGEFAGASSTLQQVQGAALREASGVVRAPPPEGAAVGFEARFKLLSAESDQRTLVQVFQCGRWFLKVRATHAADHPIDATLEELHRQVRCAALAAREPLGSQPGVVLDPALSATRVEWLAHGLAQVAWIQEHVTPENLVYGIPDDDPALYVAAWETTLDVRASRVEKGEAAPDAFLDRMLEVRNAGFLAEYVASVYFGFLPPAGDQAARREEFERWREQALPTHRHEVHAAARIGDARN